MSSEPRVYEAPYVLAFDYPRSVGPVMGRFFTGLRDGRIEGVRTRSGKVLVPPVEYDPETSEALSEFVPVEARGVVTTWAWIDEPRRGQPLDRPFAWALIRLDGADTALLHAVDAGEITRMKTGMRVRARWSAQRSGGIKDIACFVPEATPVSAEEMLQAVGGDPVTVIRTPVHLDYVVTAGERLTTYLRGLAQKKILGGRDPESGKVYVPPRGAVATSGLPTEGLVEVAHTGTLTTFCIINIPFENMAFKPPYAMGAILLDGSDLPIFHLVRGLPVEEVRMGLRLRAVWVPDAELGATLESIRWFEPSGEPDAEYASYSEHL